MTAGLTSAVSDQPVAGDRCQQSAQQHLPQQQQQHEVLQEEADQQEDQQQQREQQERRLRRQSTGTAEVTEHEFVPFVDTLAPLKGAWPRTVYACFLPCCGPYLRILLNYTFNKTLLGKFYLLIGRALLSRRGTLGLEIARPYLLSQLD